MSNPFCREYPASDNSSPPPPNNNTKFGALVNGSMDTAAKIGILDSLGNLTYTRDAVMLFDYPQPGSHKSVDDLVAAGKKVLLNLVWQKSPSGPVPFPTDMVDYASRVTQALDDISLPEVSVIENEEINDNHHSGPLSDYVIMLETATPIVHAKGGKVANGGIYGAGLHILVFRYLKATYSQTTADGYGVILTHAQYLAANNPGSNAVLEARKDDVLTVLNGIISAGADYVNVHGYEDFNNNHNTSQQAALIAATPNIWKYIKEYCEAYTGKPCITNETGVRNNIQPLLITSVLIEFDQLSMEYVLWFDGIGTLGAVPLNDQFFPYKLQPNGVAFKNYITML